MPLVAYKVDGPGTCEVVQIGARIIESNPMVLFFLGTLEQIFVTNICIVLPRARRGGSQFES